jgi:hypothetical protein
MTLYNVLAVGLKTAVSFVEVKLPEGPTAMDHV